MTEPRRPAQPPASIYLAWRAGRCPCCGGPLDSWEWRGEVTEPQALAELVMLCGRCVANEHGRESTDFASTLLECIATKSDKPLDDLLDRIGNEALASERSAELDREARRP